MKKKLWIACLVCVGLLVLAVIALPFFLDEETIRSKAETSLSAMLERKVELGKLSLSVGWGVKAGAESLWIGPALEPGEEPPAEIRADGVRFRVALLPLLKGTVDVRSLAFDRGQVTQESQPLLSELSLRGNLKRDSQGIVVFNGNLTGRADFLNGAGIDADFKTRLEGDRLEILQLEAALGPGVIQATGACNGIIAGSLAADLDVSATYGGTKAEGAVQVELPAEETRIRFDIRSPFVDFDELAAMAGILPAEEAAATAAAPWNHGSRSGGLIPSAYAAEEEGGGSGGGGKAGETPITVAGTVSADRGAFAGLEMTEIHTSVRMEDGLLRFQDTRFDLYEGSHDGSFQVEIEKESLPFGLKDRIEHVDLDSLVAAFSPESAGAVLGTASLTMNLDGRAGDPTPEGTVVGEARLEVTDGSLTSASLLAGIAKALKAVGMNAPGGEITPFERLSADFHLENRAAITDNLELRSPNLDLDGEGSFSLDGDLDFRMDARISEEVTTALVAKVGKLGPLVRNGRLRLPMDLTGTLEEPKVGVDLDRLFKKEAKQKLRDKLKGLFRRKR